MAGGAGTFGLPALKAGYKLVRKFGRRGVRVTEPHLAQAETPDQTVAY